MRASNGILKRITEFGLILMMGVSMSACSKSWEEEVLLHDGNRIIVKRSQEYGGRHEIGQSSPISEHTIKFSLPNSVKAINWASEYGEDLGRTNFNLLALHILNGTPFLVAEPNLCLSYNKWGRPNPPYVIFRHDGNAWQRISLSELPKEFKEFNLTINVRREEDIKELERKYGYVSAEDVKKINSSLKQPEYKTILREAMKNAGGSRCGEMIYDGKGGWIGVGWFGEKPSYGACLNECKQRKIETQYCPCETLFKEKK